MENETAIVAIEKNVLGDLSECDHDQVMKVWDLTLFYTKEIKRVKELVEAEVIKWCQKNGDLVVSDQIRYYAGKDRTVKCVDVPATVEAVMQATGGDFKAFCDVLASNAIKNGAAKRVLTPELYGKLFQTVEKDSLEEGKVKLIKRDERFVKVPPRAHTPSMGVTEAESMP